MGQTAIFGGTFNPPHVGHVEMARWAAEKMAFDRVLVMPAKLPPHKTGCFATPEQRLAMCRLAFSDIPRLTVSEEELYLPGKSYTVETLRSLAEKGLRFPSLIIGADSLLQFHTWLQYQEILSLASLTVYQREGIDPAECKAAAERLSCLGGRITLTDYTPIGISSTAVRKALQENGLAEEWLTPAVADYIRANGLYSEEMYGTDL